MGMGEGEASWRPFAARTILDPYDSTIWNCGADL